MKEISLWTDKELEQHMDAFDPSSICNKYIAEILRLRGEVYELERSIEVAEDPELQKRMDAARSYLDQNKG